MTDFYLIKRPVLNASTTYEYKTDVLASYGNKEDRIAQRDIPRMSFGYSFLVSDLKEALNLNSQIHKAGNVGSVWVPDWSAGHALNTIVSGDNEFPVTMTNFAETQYGVLYVSDAVWTVVEVTVRNGNLIFESTVEYDSAVLMPLFPCEVVGEPEITQANSLCYAVNLTLRAKRPIFSAVSDWNTKYLGHDVWCGFSVTSDSSEVTVKAGQTVQENDYEIGVSDRFTFFDRMYNSFGVTVFCKENELPVFRNFIKRRWGMTYSCFMPSGQADFQKAGNASDTVGSYLRIRNNKHDFSARPYIVIQTDETANYAHVIALQDDNGNPVESDYSGEFITLVLEESFSFKYKDIDSVQILYFVRLADDSVTFGSAGVSADNETVWNCDVSFIETDFYDSALINYDDTWGRVKDVNTVYLFKVTENGYVFENTNAPGYQIVNNNSDWQSFIVPGKYDGTYAVKDVTSLNSWILKPAWGKSLIGDDDDFVFQVEGKFDEYEGNAERYLLSGNIPSYCIQLFRKNGYYWIYIGAEKHPGSDTRYVKISMKMNRWFGDEFGWHEWAVQRHNGKLYFLCDGLLCGTSRDLFKHGFAGTTDYDGAINYPQYQIARGGTVQQFRLAKGLNVYTGEMSVMNREYKLNDYSLTKLREFDNATVCIVDFKNYNDQMGQTFLNGVSGLNYDTYSVIQFLTGDSPRVRRAVEITADQPALSGNNTSPAYTKTDTGLAITNSTHWCLHPNIRFEMQMFHDFWFEFTMVLSDDQSWTKQCIFPLRGIMVNILISGGQYTVEACNMGSGVYVNIGEPLTFALGVSSQDNKIVTYVNGVRSAMTPLDTYMAGNEAGEISVYPLALRKGTNLPSRTYYLHRLRLIEKCLTVDESYTVADEWTLGDYHTVHFTMEYGTHNLSNTKILSLKNIESVHPFAPYFLGLKQCTEVDICNKTWSDGSKKTEIQYPVENTLYTVTLTDPKTGVSGHGWFYVYPNRTGVLFESRIGSHQEYNAGTQTYDVVNDIGAIRYSVSDGDYKPYDVTILRAGNIAVVPSNNNLDYLRTGNSLYFRGSAYYTNYQFSIDFLGDSGKTEVPGDLRVPKNMTRWLNEHHIKQVEFVVNPPVNFCFAEHDRSAYRDTCQYDSRHMQMWSMEIGWLQNYDLYSDYQVPANSEYTSYSAIFGLVVRSGCDYWSQWNQRINQNNYVLGYRDGIIPEPGGIDPYQIHLTPQRSDMSPNVNPVHVVVQFSMTNILNSGGYYAYSSIQQIEKVWINGKEYQTVEQWWNQYKSKFAYNRKNVTVDGLLGNVSGIANLFKGYVEYYCKHFMEQAGTGHGAIWGTLYGGGNRQANGWSRYISCIKAYENEHYQGDFDAETVMTKLQNERLPAVQITE